MSAGKPPTQRWCVLLPASGGLFYPVARTASEARAQIKQVMGLPRLPAGTRVTKAGAVEDAVA